MDVQSEDYKAHLASTGHKLVKLTITAGDLTSDVYIELFTGQVPNTVGKFIENCSKGYAGLSFERVLRGGFIQTGKVEGGEVFPDESFSVPFEEYTVGMSNEGPHTNSGQFFITLAKAPYLSAKYVAFGKVVAGFDIVDTIGAIECLNERPVGKCVIDSASEC
ncbi:hypothetical protein TrCOL_g5662 [Triparma columacea]|uniref:Peptidyl-prolyl cis-trans isomerase n=1 Tax=Triparma columacea TaxID=722753 RepID=A0A9W7GNM9_9STRA|nr:hypothetical protein TrCOL_g5662 [Triparma columacea]